MPSGSFVADKNIGWKRKVDVHRPEVASGTAVVGSVGGSNALVFLTGQTYRNRMPIPMDADPTYPIGVRVRCSTPSVVPADTATWTVLLGKQAALGDSAAAPATTLVATGADGSAVPVVNGVAAQANARQDVGGGIASNFFTAQEISDRVELVWDFSVVLVGMANIAVHEFAFDYVPKKTKGEGQDRDSGL